MLLPSASDCKTTAVSQPQCDDEAHHRTCVPDTGLWKLAPSWPPGEEHLSAAASLKFSGSASNESIEIPIHLSSPCPSSLAACPAKNWFQDCNSCVQMIYWLCSLLFLWASFPHILYQISQRTIVAHSTIAQTKFWRQLFFHLCTQNLERSTFPSLKYWLFQQFPFSLKNRSVSRWLF